MWGHVRCNQSNTSESRTASAVPTLSALTQKPPEWAELIPSPPGAYDGREKWASEVSMGASVGANSFTTPSSCDEAQAESSEAIIKISIPHHAERLFTRRT